MKVYALCLDGYKERRVFQQLQAEKYGLDLEIISAVDGSLLSRKHLQEAANYWSRPITEKDLGCFLSHKKAWGLVQGRGEPAIIIEDDTVFSPIITKVISKITKNINNDDDEIYDLEYVPRSHLLAKNPSWISDDEGISATRIYQNKNGLGCYCLTPSAAKKLIFDCEKEVFKLVDAFVWTRAWGKFFQIEPTPAIQMFYLPDYDIRDKNNRQLRRDLYTNKSFCKAKAISVKKFCSGAVQTLVGRIFGVSRDLFYRKEDFRNIRK